MKGYDPRVLKRTGLYWRIKGSCAGDVYSQIVNRERIEARRREAEFYRELLTGFRRGDLIFDVGANNGTKTDVFLRLGARVVAIEPDGASQETLRNRFLRYRLAPKPVIIVEKAVSDESTIATFIIDGAGSAVNSFSEKWVATLQSSKAEFEYAHYGLDFARRQAVETTTLEELIVAQGFPSFVKIDVEGYEIRVLRGLKRPVPFLSFEINLPEFKPEGLECVRLLEGLAADGKFNYTADCRCGLKLDKWLDSQEFSRVLEQCSERTIEVFWKSCAPIRR